VCVWQREAKSLRGPNMHPIMSQKVSKDSDYTFSPSLSVKTSQQQQQQQRRQEAELLLSSRGGTHKQYVCFSKGARLEQNARCTKNTELSKYMNTCFSINQSTVAM